VFFLLLKFGSCSELFSEELKMENSKHSSELRTEVERFISKSKTKGGVSDGGIPDDDSHVKVTPLTGCCYLSKNMNRECFNGFTESMCRQAATSCGCIYEFVPGGVC
jgi:hypothetical protein